MDCNRQLLLVRRPKNEISVNDMRLIQATKPYPGDGEALVRNLYVSVDPTHRVWMSEVPQYWEPAPLNEPMRANSIGIVEISHEPTIPVGALILGFGNLQDYYITSADDPTTAQIQKIPGIPITAYLSVLSVLIGATAWVAVFDILKVSEGDVVVISAGAGAVGSLACQLAKMRNATVIAITGSDEKAKYVLEFIGADAAINYKTQCVLASLKEIVPDGVDCFLDLTGGPISDSVFQCMKNFGRVALGGTISSYNEETCGCGMADYSLLLHRRISLQGFICVDHVDQMDEIIGQMVEWIKEGKIKYSEEIVPGLENYVFALDSILRGNNKGKVILHIAQDDRI